MRPDILFPLFAPVTTLKGLGPKLGKLTEKLVGPHVADLLWHLPIGIIDRRFAPHVAEAPDGFIATLTVRVEYHSAPANPRHPYKVRCSDETGQIDLTFFHARGDWLLKQLPVGDTVVVSGKVEWFNGMPQMAHPDHIVPADAKGEFDPVEPVYPMTAGLASKVLRKAMASALSSAKDLPVIPAPGARPSSTSRPSASTKTGAVSPSP